jgi:hypothetical protein
MKWNKWLFTNYICCIESHADTNWWWATLECETTVLGFWTANLSRLVSSTNVKSVSQNCRLQTYCLDSFLACKVFPPIAEPCVKMEPENIKMKLFDGFFWNYTYPSLRMLYNWYKFGCDRWIRKGTLLEEKVPSVNFAFYSIDFSETKNLSLTAHAHQMV